MICYLWSVVSNLILMMLMRNVTPVCLLYNCCIFYLRGSNVILQGSCWFPVVYITMQLQTIWQIFWKLQIITFLLRHGLCGKPEFISSVIKRNSFFCFSWGWIMDLKVLGLLWKCTKKCYINKISKSNGENGALERSWLFHIHCPSSHIICT